LLLPSILPNNVKKCIYLDCDIVCLDDIEQLWNYDISQYCLAAVEDEDGTGHKHQGQQYRYQRLAVDDVGNNKYDQCDQITLDVTHILVNIVFVDDIGLFREKR
ncbi:MAG: hypothetical protein IIT44_02680, partial [Erysipelotrichaceae bacterium]|nr:hypothetical protein [Erysipelotrichaceae bacterium]